MELSAPPKLSPGDRVAVVSPAFAAPSVAPAVHELGLRRLREEIGVEPVEYPTTRRQSSPAERAADLHAAFADPSVRAVLATIGGSDQITVLRHLDPELIRADPKPFFGFSDNTNLLNWLWFFGVAAYHGGSTMVHLGRGHSTHPVSIRSLRGALFDSGDVDITPVDEFAEDEYDWSDPRRLSDLPPTLPSEGFVWHQPDRVVTAPTWGGNLEILAWTLAVSNYVHPVERYAGCVLLLETSEEMPSADEVYRILRNMGERGLLEQFPGVLMGRPKAGFVLNPTSAEERRRYRSEQRAAVLRAFGEYHPDAMIVFDVDLGHTDPQWVLPYGGRVTVDGPARRIVAHY